MTQKSTKRILFVKYHNYRMIYDEYFEICLKSPSSLSLFFRGISTRGPSVDPPIELVSRCNYYRADTDLRQPRQLPTTFVT